MIAVRPLTYRTVPQFDGLNPLQVIAWDSLRYAGLVTYVGCGSVDRVAVGPGWTLTRMYR